MKNVEDVCVASPLQQGLIFHGLLAPESSAYSVQIICELEGRLDAAVLRRALQFVFERHSILRTCFVWQDVGEVLQVVRKEIELPWREIDWRGLSEEEQQRRMQAVVEEDRRERFEFSQAPLVRISLVRLSEQRAKLLWCHHHSLLDGWSASIVFKETLNFYNALIDGQQLRLPPVRPYSDYIAWLQQQDLASAERFWRKRLKGFTNPTPLVKGSGNSHSESTDSQSCAEFISLSTETTTALKSLSRRHQLTLNTVMQGAWALFLSRYGGGTDVVFGAVVSGRPPELSGVEEMVGLFINTLPVRVRINEREKLLDWLRQLQAEQVEMRGYEYSPLVEVQGWSDVPRGLPLFETMMVFENYPIKSSKQDHEERLQIKNVGSIEKTNYPLSFTVIPADKLVLQLSSDTGYFTKELIGRMLQHVGRLVEEMAAHPHARLHELSMLTAAERDEQLVEWNQTQRAYDGAATLHELIEAQAARTPEQVALRYRGEQVSYGELNERANRVAHYLRALGVGTETVVGLLLERSVEMVVGLLGILKAGGAYLPLDPAYPEERLRFMLADAEVPVLLTSSELRERVTAEGARVVCVDTEAEEIAAQSGENVASAVGGANLAYVIYTSGSTGKPKGVAITHGSAVVLVHWAGEVFSRAELAGVLASTSICFDLSVYELFVPLSYGGSVVLAENVMELPHLKEPVTLINTVPSAMAELVRVGGVPETVCTVNLAGEPLPNALAQRIYEQANIERVLNLYGPSEDTTYSTYSAIEKGSSAPVTIGGPVANTEVYVLDGELELVPVGVVGEIYLGGEGLARGYLKRPESTAERFVPHRYSTSGGARLYRTGDLGRRLADGRIEYLGRIDQQVKVRGFRIELGEIEAVLSRHEGVREAVVTVREDKVRGAELVAYVVGEGEAVPGSGELREYLGAQLPAYMIPQSFVFLPSLPLTPNGKIDRRALPSPGVTRTVTESDVAPRTPLEELVQNIWQEVLGVEVVGLHDNFFELGGHSLLATQVISRLRQGWQVELPLRRLFERPTVAGLSEAVEEAARGERGLVLPPLTRRAPEQPAPLSFAQQRLWFLDQLEPGNSSYNMAQAVRLSGVLNTEALAEALNEISRRHEVLRTSFATVEGVPAPVLSAAGATVLRVEDLSDLDPETREQEVRRRAGEEARQPFDLTAGPLLRVRLLRLSEEEHALLLTMHHIISDGWSMGVFMGELRTLYEAYAANQPSPLPELPVQYGDYAAWQRQWLAGAVLEEQLSYWREQLDGAPAALELPTDKPRPAQQTANGAQQYFRVPAEVSRGLQQLSRQHDATLFMTLLAVFQIMLRRYSGQDDIVVGAPIAGRSHRGTEDLIGFFVNTLVLRTQFGSAAASFAELLEQVKEVCLGAYAHQDVPFEKLVEELQPERDMSRTPLFQVMFSLHNAPSQGLELPGLKLSQIAVQSGTVKFDLTLEVVESGGEIHGAFTYNTDLYEAVGIERMAGHFLQLLEGIVQEPQASLSTISMLTAAERAEQLVEWNQTQRAYEGAATLHELIEAQAARTPEQVALRYRGEPVSYGELNERANQVAHYLRGLGVGAETVVGLLLERSVEMVVGLLGILKAGGAYLPLDPAYPEERLKFMLADAEVSVLLTDSQLRERVVVDGTRIVCVDAEANEIAAQSEENLASEVGAANLGYVIYTSGSTGKPKGVAITHGSAAVLVHWAGEVFRRAELAGVLASTSICFDLSVFELFVPLSYGGSVVLAENVMELPRLKEPVTLINTVPSAMAELVRVGGVPETVCTVNLAGEPLPNALAQRIYEQATIARVLNLYGPSEDTTYSTYSAIEKGSTEAVTIGGPVANTEVYVLDRELELVPVGVVGEIYLGGAGLARGYLKRPESTAERFVPHRYSTSGGARLYRTGDLGRRLADGRIEYLGRIDQQVKVRGFRIELGEIEAVLSRHEGVREAVVTVREDRVRGAELVAYVVGEGEAVPGSGELREYLGAQLPAYMIPQSFVFLSSLPLTPNGKIDRRALPAPGVTRTVTESYLAPRTPLEELVQNIWQEVLGVEVVGLHDNFFELGGHSLLATQVISRLRQGWQVELPLRRLFERPTVAGLSEAVEEAARGERGLVLPPLTRRAPEQPAPLSFAQQRLWFLDQLEPGNSSYNMAQAVRLSGVLNETALAEALNEISRRHEVLRTSFATVEGVPAPVLSAAGATVLRVEDLSDLDPETREQEVRRRAGEEARQPFDLTAGPLLRVRLLRLAEEEHALLLTMHHIISDGWSMGVFMGELRALYEAYADNQPSPLAELPVQYGDYAAWQRQWLAGAVLEEQLSYWRQQLAGAPAALELPTDKPRPAQQTANGAQQYFRVPAEVSRGLQQLSRQHDATLFMTLLAVFQIMLRRYSGQDDIVVGAPIAGRSHRGTEDLIGFFVNTLVLRTRFGSAAASFAAVLEQVKEVCLGAYAHQDVPFEKLVEELQPERDMSRTPLFQVMFSLHNAPSQGLELPGLKLSQIAVQSGTVKFDLTLEVVESGGEIHGAFIYNTDLYEAAGIERMADHFLQLLEGIVKEPQASLSTISMLTAAERAEQLVEWNQTQRAYDGAATLHELIEAQAARTPEQVALRYRGEPVSYGELNRRANQVAHYLRALGVGAETVVGLLLERSVEMVVGLLSILKAGGAYLPIDPEYPSDRISFMLEDADVAVLLTHEAAAAALPPYLGQTIYLDHDWELIAAESSMNPTAAVTGENPAYVLYTSGSTGRPKGVMVPHRAIVNHMQWMLGALNFTSEDRVLQKTPYTFDASVWEFYAPLMCGGTLVMAPPGMHRDAAALVRELAAQRITQLQVVPTMLKLLLEEAGLSECKELRRVFCGGEALTSDVAARFREQLAGVELCNLYGPTEATIDASIWSSASGGEVTLGRPIWNTELYVLGRELELLPVGVTGELYIGGAGLARGYVGRAELTAERFTPHPYSAVGGERLYRTGDLARYLASGELEYLGRADEQVKVRGFRIELGEIEAVLSRHQALREALVTVREDTVRGAELVAYVVADGEVVPSSGELREYLGAQLPAYMIPQSFVFLPSLPLTSNGKIDRGALPAPAPMSSERDGSFVAPRDLTELQIVQVWEDILDIRPVGVNDNFFHLGGHSLLAVRMVAQVEKRLHCRIPLAALFEDATINHLAKLQRKQAVALREPSLIPIRTSGSRSPIFFVHPVGGRVFCYTALAAHLDLDRPFYGFQSQVSEDGEPMFTTIESMAALYVEELRAVQPDGPYFLGGWSMGGVVAFEMARQLQRLDQEVKLLALIDSMIPRFVTPDIENVEPLEESDLLISFARDLELLALTPADLLTIEPAQQLTYVLDQARQAGVVPADLDLSVIQRLYALFKNNHRALWNYAPKPYAGSALLIKATERENGVEFDPALGWNKLVADLQIMEAPATHYSIVQEPYVRTLGEQLEEYCTQLEEYALDHAHLAVAG